MGIFSRFLLFLFAAVGVAAAGTFLVVLLQLIPEHEWLNEVHFLMGRPEAIAGTVAFLVVGVVLFFASFLARSGSRDSRRRELLLAARAAGEVSVATAAVRDLVERTARDVRGVRDARAQVRVRRPAQPGEDGTVRISLELVLGTEAPVKEATSLAHEAVLGVLTELLGLSAEEAELEISVASITRERLPRKQRVS